MKVLIPLLSFFFLPLFSFSQKVNGKLLFNQGQTVNITIRLKTTISQQAGGQAIDFNAEAQGDHQYKITNSTPDNTTLHHQVEHIGFSFDGMGRKMNFDSGNEKDLNGLFGGPVKEILQKTYDMIIDTSGSVLMAIPEKIQLTKADSRMAIIMTMLKDITDAVYPPEKGKPSFFKILPDKELVKGDTWTTSSQNENAKSNVAYAITDINDSTLVVGFAGSSLTITKAEMMGGETTTTLNNKSTGTIILDRTTGLIKEKTETIESSGNTVSSFGTLPVTSKTSVTITVKSP